MSRHEKLFLALVLITWALVGALIATCEPTRYYAPPTTIEVQIGDAQVETRQAP